MTTLLDPIAYTKEDLADLFLKRWNVELDLRSIKIVLQMDVLRCQSPDLVDKEIWVHMLAYNIIRGLMATAAAKSGSTCPRELSFKGTLQASHGLPGYHADGGPRETGTALGRHVRRDCLRPCRRSTRAI